MESLQAESQQKTRVALVTGVTTRIQFRTVIHLAHRYAHLPHVPLTGQSSLHPCAA